MRDIKFRVWDGEKMFYPDLYFFDDEGIRIYPGGSRGLIVEQFTGLKDKNGKEIYEGDIIKCSFISWWLFKRTNEVRGVVEYIYTCGSYYLGTLHREGDFTNGTYIGKRTRPTWWSEYEVIGNIHENPELLK